MEQQILDDMLKKVNDLCELNWSLGVEKAKDISEAIDVRPLSQADQIAILRAMLEDILGIRTGLVLLRGEPSVEGFGALR